MVAQCGNLWIEVKAANSFGTGSTRWMGCSKVSGLKLLPLPACIYHHLQDKPEQTHSAITLSASRRHPTAGQAKARGCQAGAQPAQVAACKGALPLSKRDRR